MRDSGLNRRHLIRHVGAVGVLGLSGCTVSTGSDDQSGRKITDLSVSGLDSDPISVTANVTNAWITPNQTAKFELTVTKQHDDSVRMEFGNAVPFSYPQRSEPPGIILLPENKEYERESAQTWIPAEPIIVPREQIVIEASPTGGNVTREWAVWGDPDHVSRAEPGTYEFSSDIGVDPPGDSFQWTLSLTIAEESGA